MRSLQLQRARPPWLIGVVAVVVAAGVAWFFTHGSSPRFAASTASSRASRQETQHYAKSSRQPPHATLVLGQPTSLAGAQAAAGFPLLYPHDPAANDGNLTGALTMGKGAIQLNYPVPDAASSDLDQPYVSIYEAPWVNGDPKSYYQADIAANPDIGKSICQVSGSPALCVEPRSPSSTGQSNPAFVRTDINGTDVEVAGANSLDRVLSIAASMNRCESSAPCQTR